jgi:ubiquinone/menaquinone biosynthesis C-methylase UbiE
VGFLLDLGCGAGATTASFSSDVSSVGAKISSFFERRNSRTHNPQLEFVQGSGADLPFKEKRFSTIILNDVL